jgi:hypothetical protein
MYRATGTRFSELLSIIPASPEVGALLLIRDWRSTDLSRGTYAYRVSPSTLLVRSAVPPEWDINPFQPWPPVSLA